MSMIEGIGDEVTICFGILSLLLVILLAWISTNVQDPIIRIIILDRASLRRLLQRIQNIGTHRVLRTESNTGSASGQTETRENVTANVQTHIVVTDTETLGPEDTTVIPQENSPADTTGTTPDVSSVSSGTTNTSSSDTSIENVSSITEGQSGQKDNLAYQAALSRQQVATLVKVSSEPQSDVTPGTDGQDDKESSAEVPLSPPVDPSQSVSQNIGAESDLTDPQQPTTIVGPSNVETSAATGPDNEIDNNETLPPCTEEVESSETANAGVESSDIPEGSIRIKIKYLDERQKVVHAKPDDTIGQFKRHHFASEIAENFAVRFIYNGQELRRDSNTLQSYNIQEDSVIHCLLSQVSQTQPHHQPAGTANLDLGFLMYPLFGLILALIWYCRFTYRGYFNAMSTFSLIGITFLFVVATLATFRNHHDVHEHHE